MIKIHYYIFKSFKALIISMFGPKLSLTSNLANLSKERNTDDSLQITFEKADTNYDNSL